MRSRSESPAFLLQWGRDFSVAEGRIPTPSRVRPCCFNGAATLVSRKDGAAFGGLGLWRRFNGAATLVSRKDRKIGGPKGSGRLQWGRDFSVAEGVDGDLCMARREGASMGPRL